MIIFTDIGSKLKREEEWGDYATRQFPRQDYFGLLK